MKYTYEQLAKMIDHSLLHPTMTDQELEDGCRVAAKYRVASVCIKPYAVKRAVELLPESQDAFDGPKITASLAEIYALTGESDEAFRLLDHLLQVPNGLTVHTIKLDPAWDPLRKDPRFQALIEKYATN